MTSSSSGVADEACRRSSGGVITCFHCHEEGHIARNCPQKSCFLCGRSGHIKRDCPDNEGRERRESGGERRRESGGGRRRESGGGRRESGGERRREGGGRRGGRRESGRSRSSDSSTSATSQTVFPEDCGPPDEGGEGIQFSPHSSYDATESSSNSRLPDPSVRDNPVPSAVKGYQVPFIDTHCHLEYVFERFQHRGSFKAFTEQHKYPANFGGCITTFCDPAALSPSVSLREELLREENVWGTFGVHPHNAKYYYSGGLEDRLVECLGHPKCVAFGEIGLDYAEHSPSDSDTQKEILKRQLSLATAFQKPLLLHCREAEPDLLSILSSCLPPDWLIHLHCYTGSPDMASQFLSSFPNLYIGVTGNVTFKNFCNDNVRTVARDVPLDRLVVETDAPYNVPHNLPRSLQSKYGHPSMAFYVAKEISRLRQVNLTEVLEVTRKNTTTLYGV